MKLTRKPVFSFVAILAFATLNLYCGSKSKSMVNENTSTVKKRESEATKPKVDFPYAVTDLAGAHKAVVGTWTGECLVGDYGVWFRVVVDSNFTSLFVAKATAAKWGRAIWHGRTLIRTAKYIDTGKRYYFLLLRGASWLNVGDIAILPGDGRGLEDLTFIIENSQQLFGNGGFSDIQNNLYGTWDIGLEKRDTIPFTP